MNISSLMQKRIPHMLVYVFLQDNSLTAEGHGHRRFSLTFTFPNYFSDKSFGIGGMCTASSSMLGIRIFRPPVKLRDELLFYGCAGHKEKSLLI